MADFNLVILLLGLIPVNVLAINQVDLELRLQALEKNKVESDKKFRELETKLNVKENELEKSKIDLNETKSKLRKTISEVEYLKSSIRGRRVSEPEPIAFHAQHGGLEINLAANQKIIFRNSLVNSGHAYNNNTGIFTCPKSGVYFLTLTIMSFLGDKVETELVVNGDSSGIMLTYSGASSSPNRYDSGSNSVVWKLNAGDRVWPRLLSNTIYSGDKIYGYNWSTFTGSLVHATQY